MITNLEGTQFLNSYSRDSLGGKLPLPPHFPIVITHAVDTLQISRDFQAFAVLELQLIYLDLPDC